jgi:hypothetical protein
LLSADDVELLHDADSGFDGERPLGSLCTAPLAGCHREVASSHQVAVGDAVDAGVVQVEPCLSEHLVSGHRRAEAELAAVDVHLHVTVSMNPMDGRRLIRALPFSRLARR